MNVPSSARSIISCLIWALLTLVNPVPTYFVLSKTKFAYPFNAAVANWVLYLLRRATLTDSTDVTPMVLPRCSTPYSTISSTIFPTLVLASANVPNTNGLKSKVLEMASNGPNEPSAVAKCVWSFWCKIPR